MLKKFLIIIICLLNLNNFNVYGIVRDHRIDDAKYVQLAQEYDMLVRIETDSSFGTGIIIDPTTIISSAHNIKFKQNIRIIYGYQEFIPKQVIYHKNLDIVILKVHNIFNNKLIERYKGDYLNQDFTIAGYGYSGTGLTGARVRDFKLRAGNVRCSELKGDFCECLFASESDLGLPGCAAKGDSGGGVFSDKKLVGVVTYVSGQGGDGCGDSTYGDRTAFIPINKFEDWLLENL